MNKLEEARIIIDECDTYIREAFIKRMRAVSDVLAYKKANNLPVLDRARENALIEANINKVPEELKPYYKALLKELLNLSKEYQEALLNA